MPGYASALVRGHVVHSGDDLRLMPPQPALPSMIPDMPVTPREFAAARGFSERAVRKKARELGTCRILGNRMILEDEDVRALLEALKPNPLPPLINAMSAGAHPRTSSGSYEELRVLRARLSRRGK